MRGYDTYFMGENDEFDCAKATIACGGDNGGIEPWKRHGDHQIGASCIKYSLSIIDGQNDKCERTLLRICNVELPNSDKWAGLPANSTLKFRLHLLPKLPFYHRRPHSQNSEMSASSLCIAQ